MIAPVKAQLTRQNSEQGYGVDQSETASNLEEHFLKLQSIKKAGMLSVFKKQVDVPEEEVLKLLFRCVDQVKSVDYFTFLVTNYQNIQVFFGISFNTLNKNRLLADHCIQICLKMISRIAQLYIDVMQQKRDFKNKHQTEKSKLNILENLFHQSVGFLSLLFVSKLSHVIYNIKVDKLKIYQNLVHRLNSPSSVTGSLKSQPTPDPWAIFKTEVFGSVSERDVPRLITMCQAWFTVFGELLENNATKKVEVSRDNFALEIQTRIKHRNKIFELLDEYCEKLLQLNEQKEGLMGLMEKNLAQYISKVLDNADSPGNAMDLDLFKLIFIVINRLFQRRKKLFGTNMDEEELDYYMSGGSQDESRELTIMSTLSREITDETTSFQHLQKMTGKLYLQLIDKLLCGPDTNGVEKFNIFWLFINEEEFISFIEIFEPIFAQKLIQKVLAAFKKYSEKSLTDKELNRRLMVLFRVAHCTEKECGCFIYHLLTILFKLSMKCSIASLKGTMDLFFEMLRSVLMLPDTLIKVSHCYLNNFQKMFISLLRQNLDTIDKMTIQLVNTVAENDDQDDDQPVNILVLDMRRTVSQCYRKFNLFMDYIGIQGQQVNLTKEMCESILLILSGTHRVDDFVANHQYKIDLGFDEYSYVTAHDVIEAVQKRWQVKLLAFRTLLIETSSKVLKILFPSAVSEPIFQGFLKFFKQLNANKGSSTHSLYTGFITYVFLKEFNLANYHSDFYTNFLIMFDIALRGLGYYDRDARISLPAKIRKEFVEMCLQHLKIKLEPQNSRLLALQILICYRLHEMLMLDPPIIKCLTPLIFDIANEISGNIDRIDTQSPYLLASLRLLLENSFTDGLNSLLVVMLRLFTSVVTVTIPYSSFPIVLKPHLLVSGRMVLAGGFPYQTFEDLKNFLLRSEHITALIHLIDARSSIPDPQVELSKYLSISACYCQEILLIIYPALLAHCLENFHCSDEVFKMRMQLFMSFLTLDKFVFSCNTALTQFIEKSQGLLLTLAACESHQEKKEPMTDSLSSSSEQKSSASSFNSSHSGRITYVKKQWILTLLTKWVFLSAQALLPMQKLWDLIFTLKQTRDTYLLENCKILESYLSAMKGVFECGLKELRDPSYFDEGNLMSRKKMHIMMQMIDKFCRDECFEEEARLLQQNFEVNLFEFFSTERKALKVNKLFELLLSKVKKNEFKWMYLYDAKNIVLYSIAETDPQEICMIKRHISGKSSWFLKENFEQIYVKKQKLEVIDTRKVLKMPFSAPSDNNLLIKILELYRKEPEMFNYFTSKSFEENVLALDNSRTAERVSNLDIYPPHLKEYWQEGNTEPSMIRQTSMQSHLTELSRPGPCTDSNQENPDSGLDSYSNMDSQPRSSSQTFSNPNALVNSCPSQEFQGKNRLLNQNLTNPCLRFVLQMEMFTIPSQTSKFVNDYYLINPDGEKLALFKNDLNFIDKSRIVSCFKVGILLVRQNQEHESDILCNSFPDSGLFHTFVNNLGDKISESAFAKSLGNDLIHYEVGPLIPRKDKSTFEVKRVVGNVPSLIIWSQSTISSDYENIKSKFNRDIIIVEELPSQLLRIRSLRKQQEKQKLATVFLPDSLLTLNSLLMILPSYIYASQMELNPSIFGALKEEYKSISPFLDARKKQLMKLLERNKEDSRQMNLAALLDLLFTD